MDIRGYRWNGSGQYRRGVTFSNDIVVVGVPTVYITRMQKMEEVRMDKEVDLHTRLEIAKLAAVVVKSFYEFGYMGKTFTEIYDEIYGKVMESKDASKE